jgi:hypothetical protein
MTVQAHPDWLENDVVTPPARAFATAIRLANRCRVLPNPGARAPDRTRRP